MTHKELFGEAKWVSADYEDSGVPMLRGSFEAGEVISARIRICGLGFFALFLNGRRVSDDLLIPANSNYRQRNLSQMDYPIYDKLSHRIYVMEYDVSGYLREGENVIGVTLGSGWYAQNLRWAEGGIPFGRCALCYRIALETLEGTLYADSDERMKWAPGPCTLSNLYYGEYYDFAIAQPGWTEPGFNDSGWEPVCGSETPDSVFYIQTCPPDRVIRTINPKVLKEFEDCTVYDCGENISGHAVVAAREDGAEVSVVYAEEVYADGTLDFSSCGWEWQIQKNQYEHCTAGEPCAPEFCWHGFRYFSLSNNATIQCVRVVHADIPISSAFHCDNEELNWLYESYIRTQLCNMHAGIPSDCPHIERLGYTGDGQLCAESAMLLLDSREFYRKWLQDIADCQCQESGHVQHTAPFAGGGGGPAGWGGAIVVVPYTFYKQYGEIEILREFLPNMLRYFDYMHSRCENGLVCREEEGGWCLGEWCAPDGILLPEPFVNTCLYIKFMEMAKEIAAILGKPEQTAHLEARIEQSKQSIIYAYYSPQTRNFMGNLQGANSFALDIGLGNADTFKNMLEQYRRSGQYDTGIFGTDILTRLLFERGEADLAFALLSSRGENSFYNMKRQGATTLWEYWNGKRSHNHPMFGAVTRCLFTFLLGITQETDSAGYANVVIAPQLAEGLNQAEGYVTTVRGKIAVAYEKQEGLTRFRVELAPEMEAVFRLGDKELPLQAGKTEILWDGETFSGNFFKEKESGFFPKLIESHRRM